MLGAAAACLIGLMVLVLGMRAIAQAATELRAALRRSSAAAVASDELMRATTAVGDHAEKTRAAADNVRFRVPRQPGSGSPGKRHR